MKKRNSEFLGLLCDLYIVAMLVALPLYTGQGYWRLGDTKYTFFRNVTVLCLGCWLAAGLPGRLREAAGRVRRSAEERDRGALGRIAREVRKAFSMTDLAVAVYGAAVLLSALCSSYGQLPWRGYEGWFMGAFSQLLFVGIYFFVSRQYGGSLWPLYLGEAALFLVTALGLLHRLGIDPLGLMGNWNSKNWEYSHMLSTLGNINWLCGYYSVALALPAAHFLREKRRLVLGVLYVTIVPSLVLLGVQGSQGGLLILAVFGAAALICGGRQRQLALVLRRLCLLGGGFCLGMPLMWLLMRMRGEKAAIVADGNVFDTVEWYVWVLGAAFCLASFLLLSRRKGGKERRHAGAAEEREGDRSAKAGSAEWAKGLQEGRKRSLGIKTAVAAVCIGAVILPLCWLSLRPPEDGFGSGRGLLWRIALESFGQAGFKDKFLGAGPDCYGEAVFIRLGTGTEVWKGEHWEGAVYTNAHNELLSQLCNVGILGTVGYVAIFLTAFMRYGFGDTGDWGRSGGGDWMRWTALLACAMYGAHGFISFQQVLNAPLLFLVLGLCEAGSRAGTKVERERGNRHEMDEIQDKDSY